MVQKIKVLLLLLGVFSSVAQAQLELGLVVTPSLNNVERSPYFPVERDLLGTSLFTQGGGFRVTYHAERWAFSSGLMTLGQGNKMQMEFTDNNNQNIGTFRFTYRYDALMLPFLAEYQWHRSRRRKLGVGLGFYSGLFWRQSARQELDGDSFSDPALNFGGQTIDIEHYNPVYLGLNASLSYRERLARHWGLFVRPSFLYQVGFPPSGVSELSSLYSLQVELGLSYYFDGWPR